MTCVVAAAIDKMIPATIVRQRLHKNGLYGWVPWVYVSLSVQSSESRFVLKLDDKHVRVWREQRICNRLENITHSIVETSQSGQGFHRDIAPTCISTGEILWQLYGNEMKSKTPLWICTLQQLVLLSLYYTIMDVPVELISLMSF